MIVDTKVKFLETANGDYRVGVLLLQDSIWYVQVGAAGGYTYHMHQLSGPEPIYDTFGSIVLYDNHSANYTLANGSIAANMEFSNSFHFKLDSTQRINYMHPVVIVWKYDTVSSLPNNHLIYVNANDKPGFYNISGTEHLATTERYIATIYPNPTSNVLQVKLEGVSEDVCLNLYDLAGRRVLSQQVTDGQAINVGMLGKGIYVYNFAVRGQVIAGGKLSIER